MQGQGAASEAPRPPKLPVPLQQRPPADTSVMGRRKNPFTDLLPKASSPTAAKAGEHIASRAVMVAGTSFIEQLIYYVGFVATI